MTDSHVLLKRYIENHDEGAFAELVELHVNHVYSTALRRCGGDFTLTQDITQTVFISLARNARALQKHTALSGWLYRNTCFTASKALRSEQRRFRREQEAVAMQTTTETEDEEAVWQAMYPLLDEGLEGLSDGDRNAVVMRFFERRPFQAVGTSLNTTEDAARMRVNRALEKLRLFFVQRGLKLSCATLSVVLLEKAVHAAPPGLSTSSAIAATKAGAATSVGAFHVALYATLKAFSLVATVLLCVGGAGIWWVSRQATVTGQSLTTPAATAQATGTPRLANNHFSNRAVLGTPGRISRTNMRADTEGDERIQRGATRWGATLWWKWTAPGSGQVNINTVGSDYDTYLAVYTGSALNALTLVTENDNQSEAGGGESSVTFAAQGGVEYQIQVGGVYKGGAGGAPVRGRVQLNLDMPPR